MEKGKFIPQSEQVIELLSHHTPNVVGLGAIQSYLDTPTLDAAQLAVERARQLLEREGHPLLGKATIETKARAGYRIIIEE